MSTDIALKITQQFIDAIEGGMLDGKWKRPWAVNNGMPTNALTGKGYNGINALILMLNGGGEFATFNQIKTMGGKLKDAKGKGIAILRPIIKKTVRDNGSEDSALVAWATHIVFSRSLVEGLPVAEQPTEKPMVESIDSVDAIVREKGIDVRYGNNHAYYVPSADYIAMPDVQSFVDAESHAATLLHEMSHWSGHASRLNRLQVNARFGDESYAFEELIAELASSFLCAELNIHLGYMDNHAKYLASWLKVLKGDSKAIMTAASHAQKAVAFLKGDNKAIKVEDMAEAA